MKWNCEMGEACGTEDRNMKRLKHPGNLIRKQQKERKEHGSEERRLRQGSDTNRREPADLSVCVATGLVIYQARQPAWPDVRRDR